MVAKWYLVVLVVLLVGCQAKVEMVDPSSLPDVVDWPLSSLPEPNAVLERVIDDNPEQLVVNVSKMRQEDLEAFAKSLVAAGYSGGLNNTENSTVMVGGTHTDGSAVMFIYIKEAQAGSVTYYYP
jgi:hypothetical protein